jgi:glycosyltransferase involved in cell wall biosynthesis
LDILISAFKQIKEKNIHLYIVGEGKDINHFKKIADSSKNITFYGFVSEKDLIALYKKSHAVVVPSVWYETFGIVIIESFKYATPVIASNIGGFPELVKNGYNGILFEAGNVDQLKRIFENLLDNLDEIKRMSNNAFLSAKEFSMDEHISKLHNLYEEVLRK